MPRIQSDMSIWERQLALCELRLQTYKSLKKDLLKELSCVRTSIKEHIKSENSARSDSHDDKRKQLSQNPPLVMILLEKDRDLVKTKSELQSSITRLNLVLEVQDSISSIEDRWAYLDNMFEQNMSIMIKWIKEYIRDSISNMDVHVTANYSKENHNETHLLEIIKDLEKDLKYTQKLLSKSEAKVAELSLTIEETMEKLHFSEERLHFNETERQRLENLLSEMESNMRETNKVLKEYSSPSHRNLGKNVSLKQHVHIADDTDQQFQGLTTLCDKENIPPPLQFSNRDISEESSQLNYRNLSSHQISSFQQGNENLHTSDTKNFPRFAIAIEDQLKEMSLQLSDTEARLTKSIQNVIDIS